MLKLSILHHSLSFSYPCPHIHQTVIIPRPAPASRSNCPKKYEVRQLQLGNFLAGSLGSGGFRWGSYRKVGGTNPRSLQQFELCRVTQPSRYTTCSILWIDSILYNSTLRLLPIKHCWLCFLPIDLVFRLISCSALPIIMYAQIYLSLSSILLNQINAYHQTSANRKLVIFISVDWNARLFILVLTHPNKS